MSGFINTLLGRSSMDSDSGSPTSPTSAAAQRSPKSPGSNVWQGVFNPGRNYSGKMSSRNYFDNVPEGASAPTLHDYIVKAANLQRLSFNQLDKNGDGFVDADDLKKHFGQAANVHGLIDKADKDGDGRISLSEFQDMVRNS